MPTAPEPRELAHLRRDLMERARVEAQTVMPEDYYWFQNQQQEEAQFQAELIERRQALWAEGADLLASEQARLRADRERYAGARGGEA